MEQVIVLMTAVVNLITAIVLLRSAKRKRKRD
jgi:hypothetical protein